MNTDLAIKSPLTLKDSVAKLPEIQQRFLVIRLSEKSDAAACRKLHLRRNTMYDWKHIPAFFHCYTETLSRALDIERALGIGILESALPMAASEVKAIIDKPWDSLEPDKMREKGRQMIELLKGLGIYKTGPGIEVHAETITLAQIVRELDIPIVRPFIDSAEADKVNSAESEQTSE